MIRPSIAIAAGLLAAAPAGAATEDLGNGFAHHGVATPVSNHRGTVATVDGEGRNVVLVWLYDCRGGYALLMIDAETGKAEQFPMPFPPGGDGPFAAILSKGNRYYTHFNGHFAEFDPTKRAFTFSHQTTRQMAMSMTEDDNGVIWSATYPQSAVASYDPKTGAFRDYGSLYQQNWAQYPRSIAADDAGWVYFGIGSTRGQIVTLDPKSGKATPVIPEAERRQGSANVTRDLDGKVYGSAPGGATYELYRGEWKKIAGHDGARPKPYVAGSQGLFHRAFPDGSVLRECDLVERTMSVEDGKTKQVRELHFDYTSEGAHLMGVAAAPDGTLCGGTAFPMRFFSYNPKTDEWVNRAAYGQHNTVVRQGDRFFFGGYTGGLLLEWDPARPWVPTEKGKADSNPRFLAECKPGINRPHDLLACPDGHTLVLAGTPDYGYTGGGLLIYDRRTGEKTLLQHTDLLPDQSTLSLVRLPGGRIVGGTTTAAGTGGEKKAKEAELYLFDLATKKIEWHQALFPGAQGYTDLCPGPNGLIYGIVDQRRFFVFDPAQRKVVHEEATDATFGPTTSQQGPRVFVTSPAGNVYVLFVKGIARIDPATFKITMLAESPVPIGPGGDFYKGRIYFGSGSHLYSYRVPGEPAD